MSKVYRKTISKDFVEGYLEALFTFAYMKDGTYYVGTTGRTLAEARSRFIRDNFTIFTEDAKELLRLEYPTDLENVEKEKGKI